jgi:hypothetical protein
LRQRRLRDVSDRLSRLIIDRDKLGGIPGCRLRLGDDHRHGISDMADRFGGER